MVFDLYSRYFEVARLQNTRSNTVLHKLKSFFATHGIPSKVISDNVTQYSSQEFADFGKSWDFNNVTSSPNWRKGNNAAERYIQTIKIIFTKSKQDQTEPYIAILEYRNSPLLIGQSPAQLLMSRQLCSTLPMEEIHNHNKSSQVIKC